MLGIFSGYSALAVLQDIWCVLIHYNLQTITEYDCKKELATINNRRQETYKINRNIGAGTLKKHLHNLLLSPEKTANKVLKHIQCLFLNSLEKIKTVKKPRRRKKLRCNDRHQTELNYKRGF